MTIRKANQEFASPPRSRNCLEYQDLCDCQLPYLGCLARVYDVVGTSVGPARRESVDKPSTPAHCPAGTSALLHPGTDPPPARQQEYSRSEAIEDEHRAGNSDLWVFEQGR